MLPLTAEEGRPRGAPFVAQLNKLELHHKEASSHRRWEGVLCSIGAPPRHSRARGSLFLTRPSIGHYTLTRDELLWRANDVLGWVRSGQLKVHIGSELPLAEAAEAHRRAEARLTTGKTILLP
ncbi:MAG: zinc-binding dehydrogenase [Dehalococcoidales bacterium]|nr:zinc-binding dehydrogenase [Dehalococcoidales bacterium]